MKHEIETYLHHHYRCTSSITTLVCSITTPLHHPERPASTTRIDNEYIPLSIQGPPYTSNTSISLYLSLSLSLRVSIKPLTTILHRSSPLFTIVSFRSITGFRSSIIIIISRGEQVIGLDDTIHYPTEVERVESMIIMS